MRQRTKITVSTQLPVELVDKVDAVREKYPIKLPRLFELALNSYIDEEYPDLDAIQEDIELDTANKEGVI